MILSICAFNFLINMALAWPGQSTSYMSISKHISPSQNVHTDYTTDNGHYSDQSSHTEYNYKYGVNDDLTGDIKSQQEERVGSVVKGEYSIVQPDGKTRVVTYSADHAGGFHAYVTYY